tara:strand:+ start:5447 stop:5938 length:492 start_codon:yes stop_codon:yes gene_type:complete
LSLVLRVTGGNKFQKQLVFGTVQFCMHRLLPNVRKLDINVHIRNFKEDSNIGYCTDDSSDATDFVGKSPRRFQIEISKDLNLTDFIKCVLHEFVHLKQFVLREMVELDRQRTRWKSKVIPDTTKYYDQPWEKEAYRLESQLLWECLENQEFLTNNINVNGVRI